MTPERWRAVDAVLRGALARTPEERSAYLARACGSDAALRREVESLLAAGETGGTAEGLSIPALAVPGAGRAGGDATPGPPAAEAASLLAPLAAALAGRYAVEREVGRGGMATVFLARDLRHGR